MNSNFVMEWVNSKYLEKKDELKKQFSSSKPYPHLVLQDFFQDKIKKVLPALLKEKFVEQNSDLFQFKQTNTCKKATQPEVKEFFKFCNSKEFLDFISDITSTKVTSIDFSGFIYADTDYLLPHDDRLSDRKIACVINLGKDFTKEDGGALQLFKNNKVVKSYSPKFNSLILFKVSPKSLHQVEEVKSKKDRISFGGWFHG